MQKLRRWLKEADQPCYGLAGENEQKCAEIVCLFPSNIWECVVWHHNYNNSEEVKKKVKRGFHKSISSSKTQFAEPCWFFFGYTRSKPRYTASNGASMREEKSLPPFRDMLTYTAIGGNLNFKVFHPSYPPKTISFGDAATRATNANL